MNDSAIMLFCKWPEPGRVKTRLQGNFSDARKVALYRCFVEDLVKTIRIAGIPLWISYAPREREDDFKSWLGAEHTYLAQPDGDLGDRLKHGAQRVIDAGIKRFVIIGSDSPDLTPDLLTQALDSLSVKQSVIGPSPDGGYYLIGFQGDAYLPDVFDDINWSTETVLQDTCKVFDRKGLSLAYLPSWTDIDTLCELTQLWERHQQGVFTQSATMRFLTQHQEDFFGA